MDNFDVWFSEREEMIKRQTTDMNSIKRWMKAAYFLGLDDGQEYTYRDIKEVMKAIKRSIEIPVDEERMEELWKAFLNDPDPDGDITVGLKVGPVSVITSGSGGKSTYWAANQEAPLTRDQQIALIQSAKERHAENMKRITNIIMENKNDSDGTT